MMLHFVICKYKLLAEGDVTVLLDWKENRGLELLVPIPSGMSILFGACCILVDHDVMLVSMS